MPLKQLIVKKKKWLASGIISKFMLLFFKFKMFDLF